MDLKWAAVSSQPIDAQPSVGNVVPMPEVSPSFNDGRYEPMGFQIESKFGRRQSGVSIYMQFRWSRQARSDNNGNRMLFENANPGLFVADLSGSL
jgi:hypothetical protein